MNKKGEMSVGWVIGIAVGIIVALVLFQASAQQIGKAAPATYTHVENRTITSPANGGTFELIGQELVGSYIVRDGENGTLIPGVYNISECVRPSDSLKGICYKQTATRYQSNASINVSYDYYPEGYIDDAGGRAIAGIIVLLAAIAIAIAFLPKIQESLEGVA